MRQPALGAAITLAAFVVWMNSRPLMMAAASAVMIAAFFGLGTYEWIRYKIHGPRRDQP